MSSCGDWRTKTLHHFAPTFLLLSLAWFLPHSASADEGQVVVGDADHQLVLTPPQTQLDSPPRSSARPVRLSVSLASVDTLLVGVATGLYFGIANDPDYSPSTQRSARYVGGVHAVTAAADLGWLLYSSVALHTRKHGEESPFDLTPARTGLAFTSINSARWLTTLAFGFAEVGDVNASTFHLVTGGVLLALHAWGLAANGKELRQRKRGRGGSQASGRRIHPVAAGFSF